MEPPSAPAHRGHVPWHRLLLAVSLLTFWNLPTTAQITVESVSFNAVKGRDVLLLVHNAIENILAYHWYRGERVKNSQLIASYEVDRQVTITGPAHSGREIIYPNGSLLFQKVNQNDTGYYTLNIIYNDLQTESVMKQLYVYPPVAKPIIEASNTTVTEHGVTVVLKCLTNDTGVAISWFFNGQSLLLTERMELSQDNSTLTIEPVRREDAGNYQCEASNLIGSSKSDPSRVDVILQENGPVLSVGAIVGIVIGVLVVVALVAALGCFIFLARIRSPGCLRNSRENWYIESTPGYGPSSSSLSPACLSDRMPEVPIYQELVHPDTDIYCGMDHKANVAS
ncbi:carcinoembryonic antigen-related cell adhesion molecule 3-like [Phacochoerus africanus]|uniref:carcinoembryonic antigen-related cell adhesion molecule 3-like n=1 Tax=Phacochoerus africanus TaxID=41426 RepID=UPI001FD9E335|nr:carcinoembryonic antigen-related cell adhesion molecule 3-like [Phacochoerus africanus]